MQPSIFLTQWRTQWSRKWDIDSQPMLQPSTLKTKATWNIFTRGKIKLQGKILSIKSTLKLSNRINLNLLERLTVKLKWIEVRLLCKQVEKKQFLLALTLSIFTKCWELNSSAFLQVLTHRNKLNLLENKNLEIKQSAKKLL